MFFNELTELNIDGLKKLQAIVCSHNLLNSFSAKGCTALRAIDISHNNLSADATLAMISGLEKQEEAGQIIFFNSQEEGEEHNTLTDEAIKAANAKRWMLTNGEEEITSGIASVGTSETNALKLTCKTASLLLAKRK